VTVVTIAIAAAAVTVLRADWVPAYSANGAIGMLLAGQWRHWQNAPAPARPSAS